MAGLEDLDEAIGRIARTRIPLNKLANRLAQAVNRQPTLLRFGPDTCRCIGLLSGDAGSSLTEAARAGVDTFITGEGRHWTFPLAQELEMNILYAGHYATETFGVRALAQYLGRKFRLPVEFLDSPSGL